MSDHIRIHVGTDGDGLGHSRVAFTPPRRALTKDVVVTLTETERTPGGRAGHLFCEPFAVAVLVESER
jgi:hypothetical protein